MRPSRRSATLRSHIEIRRWNRCVGALCEGGIALEPTGNSTLTQAATPRRSRLLPVLLAVVVGAALVYRTTHLQKAPDPLRGNTEETPGALADLLRQKPEAERLPFLLECAKDPSPGLRYAAVDALSGYQGGGAVDTVEAAIHDLDSETRKRAVEVLPDLDRERGLRLLVSALRDEDPWIRECAVTQINSRLTRKPPVIDGRAVAPLIRALDDPDLDVSFSAMSTLIKLTGKPWRVSRLAQADKRQAAISEWKRWWAEAQKTWPGATALADVPPSVPTRTDPCPDFYLQRLDGKELSLHSQQGRLTLLNFWSTQCGPCVAETPDLVELDRRYRDRKVDVIGVAVADRDAGKLLDWCRAHGANYPEAFSNAEVLRAFGNIEDVPVTVLIDGKGRLRNVWQGGPRGPEVYSTAIERALKEQG